MRISGLLQERRQVGSVFRREEVATPGEQATDTHRILRNFVATHAAIAFFDPPANGALTGVVGAVERFSCGSFPRAVARQAMPQVPARKSTRAASDRPGSDALPLVGARPPDSVDASLPVRWPAPALDS